MPFLLLRELPRYECLLGAAEKYPTLNPSSVEAFLNLLRTGDLVSEAGCAHLSEHGVSQGRFTILMILSRMCESSVSPAALAERSGVTRATVSGLLDTMERDGLVTRAASVMDRRAVEVQLTANGQDLVDAILPGYFARVEELISPLDADERATLVTLLQKIQAAIKPSSDAPTPLAMLQS